MMYTSDKLHQFLSQLGGIEAEGVGVLDDLDGFSIRIPSFDELRDQRLCFGLIVRVQEKYDRCLRQMARIQTGLIALRKVNLAQASIEWTGKTDYFRQAGKVAELLTLQDRALGRHRELLSANLKILQNSTYMHHNERFMDAL